nr:hypothetical protein AGR96Xp_00022 [Serratia proteamaculans]ULG13491.1 hypothetical protein 1Ap1_00111 [Serratia proteamaculans]ULG19476.1 hypothetical protein Sprot5p_00101 [Serratia proteamaculans]
MILLSRNLPPVPMGHMTRRKTEDSCTLNYLRNKISLIPDFHRAVDRVVTT